MNTKRRLDRIEQARDRRAEAAPYTPPRDAYMAWLRTLAPDQLLAEHRATLEGVRYTLFPREEAGKE